VPTFVTHAPLLHGPVVAEREQASSLHGCGEIGTGVMSVSSSYGNEGPSCVLDIGFVYDGAPLTLSRATCSLFGLLVPPCFIV